MGDLFDIRAGDQFTKCVVNLGFGVLSAGVDDFSAPDRPFQFDVQVEQYVSDAIGGIAWFAEHLAQQLHVVPRLTLRLMLDQHGMQFDSLMSLMSETVSPLMTAEN